MYFYDCLNDIKHFLAYNFQEFREKMKYKKIMFMLVLAVFLLSIAGVCASDTNDTAMVSQDDTAMESTDMNVKTVEDSEPVINAAEDGEILSASADDEIVGVENDLNELRANPGTYSELSTEIGSGGNIALTHDYYTYDSGSTIVISIDNSVIEGNGAIIDMAGSNMRAFNVTASSVTIKNLTIKNGNVSDNGGAIYFEKAGTVENCNFVNNNVSNLFGKGGAVYFNGAGNVINCNFTDNYGGYGGAVYFSTNGDVSGCSFVNNTAIISGGAVFIKKDGVITDCNFTNNFAVDGSAILIDGEGIVENCIFVNNSVGSAVFIEEEGKLENCIFVNNSAEQYGGAVILDSSGTIQNCNFTDNQAEIDGGAIYIEVYGIVENCIFVNNNATRYGGAICFYEEGDVTDCIFVNNSAKVGGALLIFENADVTNCNFTNNAASSRAGAVYFNKGGEVTDCIFTNNTAGDYGGAVWFTYEGIVENCIFVNNNAAQDGGAVYFYSDSEVNNCNFTNNNATRYGGAVYFYSAGEVNNCNFTNNNAKYGGAIDFDGDGTVENCIFVNNSADDSGGAVYFYENGEVTNCNFTGNNATTGSAIYFYSTSSTKTVFNSRFLNNRANAEVLEVTKNDNNITITFTGNDNLLNAIYSRNGAEVTFTNVTYWGANGITTVSATMSGSNKATGQNITVGVVVNNELVLSDVMVTNESGMIVLDISAGENYYISARHDTDSYYTEAVRTITNNTKFNVNVTSQTTHNRTVNITAKSNIPNDVVKGELLFILPNGAKIEATYGANGTWWAIHTFDVCGDYNVSATYVGLDNVAVTNATISISKTQTEITVENATLELIVRDSVGTGATLTPAGAGNLTFTSSNASVVKVEDGKIIAVGEGSAVITVSFAGNVDYEAAENKTITVNVNKVSTEISVLNDTIALKVRDEIATGATLTPADAGNLTYTVSNSSVVKVEDGKIIALKEGSATITVSFAGDDKYAAAESKTIGVTVSKVPTEITVENATVELSVDGSVGIGATLTPADAGDLTYTVSNSSVVKVEDGKIIALKEGSATITVSFAGDDKYAAAESKTIGVTVSKVPTEITVENETVELVIGGSVGVGVTLNPAHAGDVTYTVSNSSVVKVEDGKIIAVGEGSAVITVSFAGDDKYAAAENKTITVNVVKYGSEVIISPIASVVYPNNVVIKYSVENRTDVSVSIDGVSDDKIIITNDTVTVVGLDAGEYTITILNNENSTHSKSSDTKTFTVNKQATSIAASDVSTTYNINKDLVITLKDSNGNVLSGVKVTVDLNCAKTYTTDKNGQVKVSTKGLAPKTYTAKITFNGNTNYEKSVKNVKVTVKKATPKLTAKKKTFKTSVKTKKYTITLKDNTGKAIKKAKVTLKVKGKTYKATTNSKGKATFKIKKLNKKGTFKAIVTYKGNKYYNKATKKVTVKVISAWKTISKGSKAKSTVKEIQRALKNNGYYLTAHGHYLKVDGIYWDYTVKAVKQFQKAKGLKVTGKVDEKTAKKLGII